MIFAAKMHTSASGAVLHDDDLSHIVVDRVLACGPTMSTPHLSVDARCLVLPVTGFDDARIADTPGLQTTDFAEPFSPHHLTSQVLLPGVALGPISQVRSQCHVRNETPN
jgi:hypothetical protein